MSFREFLVEAYLFANEHSATIALSALLITLLSGLLVAITRRRHEAGLLIANLQLYTVMIYFMAATLGLMLLYLVFDFSLLDANVLLLVSPVLALMVTFGLIRLIFPLSELVSVRTALDLAWFAGGCAALAWFFSKFEGWGVIFFGGFFTLVIFLIIAVLLLRRVGKRAFGLSPRRATSGGGR